jgi:riboflavin kinase/FMN adenylyltransferase
MLGYEYFLCGNVVRGDGRGKTMGLPTANIESPDTHKLMPGNGVYFISSVIDKHRYYGMANIGVRPTFTNDKTSVLEVFYFNFDKDIYNREITVEFHNFIRKEKKFAGADEFLTQIKEDKNKCVKFADKFYK